jgi:hypothetical protein
MDEIRAAYQELRLALIDDGKNINDQPPADMNFYDHAGRLHHVADLLRDVHGYINREEDDPAARGLKNRALRHIDGAWHATEAAIRELNF